MRKLLFFFAAAMIITSCDNLKKKTKTTEDDTEDVTTTKKKKTDDDLTTDDTKTTKKKDKIEDDDYKPKDKEKTTKTDDDNTDSDTKTTSADLKTWNWSTYKVQFKAPSDFSIDENSASKWDAGNGKLHLSIYPKKGERLDESDLKPLLKSWARDTKLTYSGDVNKMSNLNGYWGAYIDGTGSNGLPTSVLILVDPDDPALSFYIWLQYQSKYLNTAVDILKSFKPS